MQYAIYGYLSYTFLKSRLLLSPDVTIENLNEIHIF